MKSAYELAMERLDEQQGSTAELTENQKERVAEVKKRRDAKLAEQHIMYEQHILEAKQRADAEALRNLNDEFVRDNQRIQEDADEEIDTIRNQH